MLQRASSGACRLPVVCPRGGRLRGLLFYVRPRHRFLSCRCREFAGVRPAKGYPRVPTAGLRDIYPTADPQSRFRSIAFSLHADPFRESHAVTESQLIVVALVAVAASVARSVQMERLLRELQFALRARRTCQPSTSPNACSSRNVVFR